MYEPECNRKRKKNCRKLLLNFICAREERSDIVSICACRPVTAVPDVERLVERLQHGLQYDGHAGARLQEDQFLPDDPLRGDTAARLREGVRGPESHLVSVHTHALRVWGLRALHVAGRQGGPPGGTRCTSAFVFALGGSAFAARWIVGKGSLLSARSIARFRSSRSVRRTCPRGADREGIRSRIARVIENLLERQLCTTLRPLNPPVCTPPFRRSLRDGSDKEDGE